jgi:hypothetical protein
LKHPLPRLFLACLLAAGFTLGFAGCGGGGDQTERIVDRLLTSAQDQNTQVSTFVGKVPPDMPWELPRYAGSKVLASFVLDQAGQSTYFIMLDSDDAAADVLQFYEGAFDEDPWQVEGFISGREAMAIQFSKIDDANVSGGLSVDDLSEGGSGIALSVQRIDESGAQEPKPFELGASRPLPPNFPSDVPLYPDSTVTDTTWLRSPGGVEFLVTLLTTDAQADVIDFYRGEFADRGFTVADEAGEGSAVVLSFGQPATGGLQGRLTADVFQEDAAYTQVDIQLQVSSVQGEGN